MSEQRVRYSLARGNEGNVLINITCCRAVWRIACHTILDAFPLVDANVVNEHFTWKLQMHEVLLLEGGCGKAGLVNNEKDASIGSTHERDPGSGQCTVNNVKYWIRTYKGQPTMGSSGIKRAEMPTLESAPIEEDVTFHVGCPSLYHWIYPSGRLFGFDHHS